MTAMSEPRKVWLRNDSGSPMKWPTLRIGEHRPGEVLEIELGHRAAIPFGFTEVDPPAKGALPFGVGEPVDEDKPAHKAKAEK